MLSEYLSAQTLSLTAHLAGELGLGLPDEGSELFFNSDMSTFDDPFFTVKKTPEMT